MNLKKSLLLTNFIMIVLPFIVSSIIGAGAIVLMRGTYWDPIENMFADRNEVVYAQSLIYSERQHLADPDPAHAVQRNSAMKRLTVELADLGYHLQYRLNGKEEFSNLTPEDEQKGMEMLGFDPNGMDHITASKDNVYYIKAFWDVDGNLISITAINPGKVVHPSAFSFFYTYIGFFLFVMFFFALLTMVIVNMVVYKKVQSMVLEPIKQISNAAKAIRSGDLTTPVKVSGPTELQQVCRDFTDMQAYLKDSYTKQAEYDRSRRELLSGISHDLRTPLTSIKGYAEGLMAGIANTPEKQQRYFSAIETRAGDLERLINNLSLYNNFEATLFMYHPIVCSFRQMLERYIDEEKGRFERDRITIEWGVETTEDTVYIDVTEFHRILDNLFNNAVKYRTADTSYIRLRLEKEEAFLVFLFGDDGPGIEEDSLDDIFEAFVRLDTARAHTNMGSGLGLAIVKKIVEAHHGTVRAYNDRGLTLCITLPLYQ